MSIEHGQVVSQSSGWIAHRTAALCVTALHCCQSATGKSRSNIARSTRPIAAIHRTDPDPPNGPLSRAIVTSRREINASRDRALAVQIAIVQTCTSAWRWRGGLDPPLIAQRRGLGGKLAVAGHRGIIDINKARHNPRPIGGSPATPVARRARVEKRAGGNAPPSTRPDAAHVHPTSRPSNPRGLYAFLTPENRIPSRSLMSIGCLGSAS
ncbi:hypothetical protein BH10PSE14_BH10PSE14_40410 [soil metagenome]